MNKLRSAVCLRCLTKYSTEGGGPALHVVMSDRIKPGDAIVTGNPWALMHQETLLPSEQYHFKSQEEKS